MSDYKPGSIQSIGREFCPTATTSKRNNTDRIRERNQQSAEVLARINARLGKPSPVPIRLVVDSKLRLHT